MGKCLYYNHPAVPPIGIKMNTWYYLEELKHKYTLEEIKGFFYPANFALSELDEMIEKEAKSEEIKTKPQIKK